jgi:hypothetical protein
MTELFCGDDGNENSIFYRKRESLEFKENEFFESVVLSFILWIIDLKPIQEK